LAVTLIFDLIQPAAIDFNEEISFGIGLVEEISSKVGYAREFTISQFHGL